MIWRISTLKQTRYLQFLAPRRRWAAKNKRDQTETPHGQTLTTKENWVGATTSTGTKETVWTADVSFISKWKEEEEEAITCRYQVVGRCPHLEGYSAERLSVRGDVEENRGVLVGRRRAAAVHAGGGKSQWTQLDPVRHQQHVAVPKFWLGFL